MIFFYAIAFIIGVAVFLLTARWGIWLRLILGVGTFAVLAVIITYWLSGLEDKPVGEARTITKEEWKKKMNDK